MCVYKAGSVWIILLQCIQVYAFCVRMVGFEEFNWAVDLIVYCPVIIIRDGGTSRPLV